MAEGLNPAQKSAVTHQTGPLAIIAGPGSGKTRVMTHRIAQLVSLGVSPASILAITFTNKAADEMLRRTQALLGAAMSTVLPGSGFLGPSALDLDDETPVLRTFHSFCARLLRRYIHRLEPYTSRFSIYDSADQLQLIGEVLKSLQLDRTSFPPRATLSKVSHWKNQMTGPEQASENSATFRDRELARVYFRYQELLEERDAADFDDLLLLLVRLFREHPDVLESMRSRFQFVLVDEFQDTNRPQYLIAKLLADEHRNLCVTGDPDQSIYSWRGASADNFLRFKEDFPEHSIITLDQNYRSTPQILEVASRLAGTEFGKRKLFTENDAGPEVRVQQVRDERKEAAWIADCIESWKADGVSASEIAVLYRVNALSRTFEEEFVRRRILYSVIGGMSFYERKEVKDILAYLRAARSTKDDVALLRIFNVPARGIGKVSIERFVDAARDAGRTLGEHLRSDGALDALRGKARKGVEQLRDVLAKLTQNSANSLTEQVELAIQASGYLPHLEKLEPESWQERQRNLEELVSAASETEEILNSVYASAIVDDPDFEVTDALSLFLERIALITNAEMKSSEEEQVSLMTLHSAKGLEYNKVIIIGVEENLIPHSRHGEIEGIEEERRLLYVGVTRAREELIMTHTSWRRRFHEREPRLPSSFLTELEGTSIAFERAEGGGFSKGGWQQDPFSYNAENSHDEEDGIHPGAWIRHEILGKGVILSAQGHGASKRISVRFEQGGEKQLVVAYAPVTPISPPDEEWDSS